MEQAASESIPVIDISCISLTNVDVGNKRFKAAGEKLSNALSTWGFAYLSGHGIPEIVVRECMEEAKKFFGLPIEQKKLHRYTCPRKVHYKQ